ncbi:hypothetical protein ES692_13950 [Psychroserpens burtonensis]|uniref:Uncharacterized protein n=1 Tax=Psychroserpens burtonensis TaxID=49278 RepID=A0A5C7B693_9FLAO|nr:hypothetical protein [Psychroserpens burtonensis]TXE16018.1 hypothetical protein ES692_13950 [Psychroserpens burtonensis]
MIDKEFYTCEYCFKEFEPKRRRVQKYCSNTCRSKAYHARKTTPIIEAKNDGTVVPKDIPTPSKENMSLAGVGNATAGSLIANGLKAITTSNKNKTATKGDISELKALLTSRYLPIKNIPTDLHGRHPYYDIDTKNLIYLVNSV